MASPWQPFPLAQLTGNVHAPFYAPDLAVRLICPDCTEYPPNIVDQHSSGDLVCGSCGLVLDNKVIDDGSNLRNCLSEGHEDRVENCSRAGEAHYDPLESFAIHLKFSHSHKASSSSVELLRAVARDHLHPESSSELPLLNGPKKLTTTCEPIVPPKMVADIAKQLYEHVEREGLLLQRRRKHLLRRAARAACLLIAYRLAHVPRTFNEIARLSNVDMHDLKRSYKVLRGAFNIKSGGARAPDDATDDSGTDPEGLLVRFCDYLGIACDLVPFYRHVMKKMLELVQIGNTRRTMTVVGSVIYFTGYLLGRPTSLKEVASVASLKGAAIITLYGMLYRNKGTVVPQKWIEDYRARLEWLPRPSQLP
ncbi:transcription factor [Ganoderma sinense ZZ0214-1]|uniref:General transcription factor TFIIB n=1 Tax=Ganoderma sinense ZZ0214-1 TaxID=1077348 RepID=A0A2G8RT98_9APHY|nr:transcription factor [Ganoderma sinense ZZ0214-1]